MTIHDSNEARSTSANTAATSPTRTRVIVRGVAAILGGAIVMVLGVALYQGLFVILPMYLRDPEGVQRMSELKNSPDELRAAYEAGTIPKLGTIGLALTVGMDGLCAMLGGFVTATVAARAKLTHAVALAALYATWSLIYTITNEVESILPTWVPWTRSLVSIPLGVFLGAWLCVRRSNNS